jgi:hypothetical protein
MARDRHCAHPGCTSRAGLEAHHVVFWSRGGPTDLANLILLCEAHHHRLHDGVFSITTAADGRFVFARTDGTILPDHPHQQRPGFDPWTIQRNITTEPTAPRTRWDGQRLDRAYAVSVLATRRADAAKRLAPAS